MNNRGDIFLVGFSGSGKSTVGPILARSLQVEFVDSDSLIEECFGKPITAIFAEEGEPVFRRTESEVINELVTGSDQQRVVALGGGALEKRDNRQQVLGHGLVIYLSCSGRELYRRLKTHTDRPLLQPQSRSVEGSRPVILRQITTLLNSRKKHYAMADMKISVTNRSPVEVSRYIRKRIKEFYAKSSRPAR